MKIFKNTTATQREKLLQRPVFEREDLFATVKAILENVKQNGDAALYEYNKRFDQVDLSETGLMVQQVELDEAESKVDQKLKNAIQQAAKNIRLFHESQKETPKVIETMPGVKCWRKSVPIQKVGLYIPGGTAPLFSTVLMLGIPARIANCEEIVLCTPPRKDGTIDPTILYTAALLGINQIFKTGGAQAIAAMTFGSGSIPKVDKIFGPGNQYVTEAKQQANNLGVAIDMPAGPSELMVLADETANPAFVAADLLSQAEHGTDSQVVLVAFDEKMVETVLKSIEVQLPELPRKEIAQTALENSLCIIVTDRQEALEVVNEYAPEHLIICLKRANTFAERVRNAGSVFLGNYTPESAGDYASGTNHTLPTNGFARAYSGVSLDSFYKKITFQKISKEGLVRLGPTIELMAEAEQLLAHKNAVSLRLKNQGGVTSVYTKIETEDNYKQNQSQASDSSKLLSMIRPVLRNFKPYTSARDEFKGQADIFLDANENPFDNGLNRYPDPLQKTLKSKIADLKNTNPEKIFLGNGSDEAIDLLIRLFCEAGEDSILTLPPTYGVYAVCANTAGVQVKILPLTQDFQIDFFQLGQLAFQNSKLLFICNPNNPTGSIIPKEDIEKVLQSFPGIVVVDEAYIDFASTESCIDLIDQYDNLVVLQTFSKAYGLAGLRLGMAFAQTPIINWLNKIKLPYNINQLTQKAALDFMENSDEVKQNIQIIVDERQFLKQRLTTFDFVQKVFDSQTNFLLVKVDDADLLYQYLIKKGIIVRNRSRQLYCDNCLRLTVGRPKENKDLLSALMAFEIELISKSEIL